MKIKHLLIAIAAIITFGLVLTPAISSASSTSGADSVISSEYIQVAAFKRWGSPAPVTIPAIIEKVKAFSKSGDITSKGAEQSLVHKLSNAKKSLDKGNKKSAENQLKALASEINAQSGKSVSAQAASVLTNQITRFNNANFSKN